VLYFIPKLRLEYFRVGWWVGGSPRLQLRPVLTAVLQGGYSYFRVVG